MSKIEKKDIEEEEEEKEEDKEEEEKEEKEEEEKEEEEKEEEEEDDDEEEIEKATKEVTMNLSKALDLKGLKRKIDDFVSRDSGLKRKLFSAADIKKDYNDLSPQEKIVGFFQALLSNDTVTLKALSEGTAADGGYLFPDEFRAELIKDLLGPTRMRSLVRVVPMKRDIMQIPKLGSRPHVTWTAENTAKSTTTADFSQKTLTAHKVAAILYASQELVEDCDTFDVVKLIIELFADAIAQEEDKVITAGTGSGQPTGLTACTIASVTCSGNLDFDDIIDLIYQLPSQYRQNAKFLACNVNIRELRKLKDSQNRYLWQEPISAGQPATFHGYPVVENNWLSESEIYFGDFEMGYWLGDRQRMAVRVSDIAGDAWSKDMVGIRVVERIAGNCVLEDAMRKLVTIP